MEDLKEEIKYQWVKGDNLGNVVIFKEEKIENGVSWIYFTNGKRIKRELLSEFLMETDSPIIIEEDLQNNFIKTGVIKTAPAKANPKSPIRSLIETQCDKNSEQISLLINISLPNKDIYKIIRDSYDAENVDSELYDIILSQLNNSEIQEQLKESTINFINDYYLIKKENQENGKN